MSTRLRIAVKYYTQRNPVGYHVYKGGDAIRFLEAKANINLLRPLKVKDIGTLFKYAQARVKQADSALLEIGVWRVGRNGRIATSYKSVLNQGQVLLRWPPRGGAKESPRLEKKPRPRAKLRKVEFRFDVRPRFRAVVPPAARMRVVDVDEEVRLEDIEPRDR